jgi:Protein of unknwon function (DUF3008)
LCPELKKKSEKLTGVDLDAIKGQHDRLEIYEAMTEKELDELASVKRSKLPDNKQGAFLSIGRYLR